MDLERERGITIKLNAVRMSLHGAGTGPSYELNLIDTPGHVDFTYEVSRSLAACEGAILVVDASQGIQAQTPQQPLPRAGRRARDHPGAQQDRPAGRRARAASAGDHRSDRRRSGRRSSRSPPRKASASPSCSRRSSRGCRRPGAGEDAPLRALIFDSYYDRYRGAIPSIRVVDGVMREGMEIAFGSHPDDVYEVDEVGYLQLGQHPADQLEAGEVGYVVASVRDVRDARVGDTIFDAHDRAAELLPGYQDVKSMVFAGLYPTDSEQYEELRDALEKLQLNDAQPALRAGDVHRARLRLPLRLPRPAAHGDRAGAAGARVRSRPRHARCRPWSTTCTRTDGEMKLLENPSQAARPGVDRPDRGAVREGAHHGAGRLHRRRS